MKKFMVALLITLFCLSSIFSSAMAAEPVVTSFSFASDTYHQGPTFSGSDTTFSSTAEVDLMVDLNSDSYGGLVTFFSQLQLTAEVSDYRQYYIGSQWLHVWKVSADMTFIHMDPNLSNPILNIVFKEGVLTSWSPNSSTIGETMTLQNLASADSSINFTAYPLLIGIGVSQTHLDSSQDIAFTFTNVRPVEDPDELVKIDESGNFLSKWISEGSFSASANLKQ